MERGSTMRISDYIKKRGGEPPQEPRSQPQPEPRSQTQAVPNPEQIPAGMPSPEMMDKYSRMSEEQLMQEMFRSAASSRANGQLTDDMLDSFYHQAQGFLSPEQSERMRELIRELKK